MPGNKTFPRADLWCNALSKTPCQLQCWRHFQWGHFHLFFSVSELYWTGHLLKLSSFLALCMISDPASLLHSVHAMIQWQPLEQIRPLKSKWILDYLIFDRFLLREGGCPLCEKSPRLSWWVWMWKCFTTLLSLSKGSSCCVPPNIIWGGFPGPNHDIIVVFPDSACWTRCSLWVGGNEASLGQDSHPSLLDRRGTDEVFHYTSCELVRLQLGETLFHCCTLLAAAGFE